MHGLHFAAGWARLEARYQRVREQRDVGVFERRLHAHDMGVGLGLDQAGESVAGIAANAFRFVRLLLVEHDAERNVKGLDSEPGEIVTEALNARLMADRRMGIRGAGPRVGRVVAALAVDVVEIFSLRVVGLQVAIADWPCRRDAAVVAQLAEIPIAQSEQRGAVELGVAAHIVVGVRMQRLAVLVGPLLPGVVLGVEHDGFRAPVVLLAGNESAAL